MRSVGLIVLAALLMTAAMLFPWRNGDERQNREPTKMQDPQQLSSFEQCVQQRDREIHRRVFDTIDNPDVQREILATEKERAIRECSKQYPALPAD